MLNVDISSAVAQRNVCFFAEVGRLGRSSSAAGMRQAGTGDVQRQSSLPAREALNQVNILHMYYNCFICWLVNMIKNGENINIALVITFPSARDSALADLFLAARYAQWAE